jgi:hypothetical protein
MSRNLTTRTTLPSSLRWSASRKAYYARQRSTQSTSKDKQQHNISFFCCAQHPGIGHVMNGSTAYSLSRKPEGQSHTYNTDRLTLCLTYRLAYILNASRMRINNRNAAYSQHFLGVYSVALRELVYNNFYIDRKISN